MNEHGMRDAYESMLRAGPRHPDTPELPVERLEALVAGTANEAERLRAIDVLLSTADGRRDLDVAWAAVRAGRAYERDQQSIPRSATAAPRRPPWRALAAAALLVVVAGGGGLLWTRGPVPGVAGIAADPLRGTESPVTLLSPLGGRIPEHAVRFTWRPVRDAREYLLVVVDTAGGEVFARATADTGATLPDSIRLTRGGAYLWWVQASLRDGTTLSAVTQRVDVR